MKFFPLTRWKFYVFLPLFFCSYILITIFWSFYRIASCPIQLPSLDNPNLPQTSQVFEPQPALHSNTIVRLDDTITSIGAILSNNFNPCSTTPNPSFQVAWQIIKISLYIIGFLISYVISCTIIFLCIKKKPKKDNKRR